MKAHYSEYVLNILKNYSRGQDRTGKIVFLKHYSAFEVSRDEIEKVVNETGVECIFLFHAFKRNQMQEPYEPVMGWIRKLCEGMSDEEVKVMLDEAGVYRLHIPIFQSYIKDGICRREEQLIACDAEYEKERFLESLLSIMSYLSAGKLVIAVFHRLHYAQLSTIQLITRLLNMKNKNISLVCGYNDMYIQEEYIQRQWGEMIRIAEKENYIVECGVEDNVQHTSVTKNIVIDVDDIDEYLLHIKNLIISVAWSEAEYYMEMVYNKIINEQLDVSEEDKMRILELYAGVAILRNKLKLAFLLCEKISTLNLFYENSMVRYQYNYLVALIKVYDSQREQAVQYVDECRRIAIEKQDERLKFESELLKYIAWFGAWREIFVWDKKIDISDEFLEKLEKNNRLNHLAYICFFGFLGSYDSNDTSEEGYIGCEKSKYFRKGIEAAERIGNKNAILRGWNKQVLFSSTRGEYDEIAYYYEKCLTILQEQNKMVDVGLAYNGLGYNCIISEKYDYADKYFMTALNIFVKEDEPEYVMESLYNMAIKAMSIGDMQNVIMCISMVIRMMRRFGIERMRLCNISKLYGLLIIAYIKVDRIYDAKLYCDKMRRVVRHLKGEITDINYENWEDDLFIYNMVEGMLEKEEKNYEQAEQYFSKNIFLINVFSSKQEYIYAQFICEMADLYDLMQEEEKRVNILKNGIEYCQRSKNAFKEKKLKALLEHEVVEWSSKNQGEELLSDELRESIEDMTEKHGINIELQEKSKALLFFESWVDLINNENLSINSIINSAMSTVQNTYNLDSLLWIEVNPDTEEPVIKYSDRNSSITKGQAKTIIEHVSAMRKNIVVDRIEKSFDDNDEIVGIFDKEAISSLVAVPIIVRDKVTNILVAMRLRHMNFVTNIHPLTESEANIFRTTFRQLVAAIKREEFKARLEESSVTDILTGLLNRQGMKKYIENQFVDMDSTKEFTVLYMDLDNFKYCNDHFGHEVGDTVLVSFSKMLEGIVFDEGSIVRYGGDEFVIILPGVSVADGIVVADDIFDMLRENKGFKEDIEHTLGKGVSVEKENRVSCSIGVASGVCNSDKDMLEILRKADKALYKIKRTTKHDYAVWTPELENE